jgi:hypothetical protein
MLEVAKQKQTTGGFINLGITTAIAETLDG